MYEVPWPENPEMSNCCCCSGGSETGSVVVVCLYIFLNICGLSLLGKTAQGYTIFKLFGTQKLAKWHEIMLL